MALPASTSDLTLKLMDSKSATRRSAARSLRKRRDPSAGPALLAALEQEIQDPRTWETQYQMIMALGESDVISAIPLLQTIAHTPREATMVFVATGDALIRLAACQKQTDAVWHSLVHQRHEDVISGALRGTHMAHLPVREETVMAIMTTLQDYPSDHPIMFWAATAAWRWTVPAAHHLLTTLASSPRADIQKAARQALQGKAVKHHVL
ncbi:HEAT repeat domain-containing protein [Deinococcus sonorensis]|uniref:HEAT repeat domain-containing protein n=1 Tax=Deinococcus sonorensis TaxID=309891 RepID=A0ABV8YCJ0_9DEIO